MADPGLDSVLLKVEDGRRGGLAAGAAGGGDADEGGQSESGLLSVVLSSYPDPTGGKSVSQELLYLAYKFAALAWSMEEPPPKPTKASKPCILANSMAALKLSADFSRIPNSIISCK